MVDFEVYRGETKVVSLLGEEIWVEDDQSADCRLVLALLSLGIPQERNTLDRLDFWRVQVGDQDFVQRLTDYLRPHGLEVRTSGTGVPGEESS